MSTSYGSPGREPSLDGALAVVAPASELRNLGRARPVGIPRRALASHALPHRVHHLPHHVELQTFLYSTEIPSEKEQ